MHLEQPQRHSRRRTIKYNLSKSHHSDRSTQTLGLGLVLGLGLALALLLDHLAEIQHGRLVRAETGRYARLERLESAASERTRRRARGR